MKIPKVSTCFACVVIIIFSVIVLSLTNLYAQTTWSENIVESVMQRDQVHSWAYPDGFYSFAQYRVWQATGNSQYFDYIKANIDSHIDANGNIDTDIYSLDNSEPGLMTLLCYIQTGEEKYKTAVDYIRNIYNTYPRTSDGGFWHSQGLEGQLWLDGVYMILPFLVRYAQVFNDPTLYTEAANQIIIYASHLQDDSGLLFHAYDEDGSAGWADPVTHHSSQFWGRSMGWFGMAIIEVLEILPQDHPKRDELIQLLSELITGLSQYQDEETGLWFQVVNRGDHPENWLESSCSSMYSYITARAVEKSYVDSIYLEMALRGVEGVLNNFVEVDNNGLVSMTDICQGTGVSSDISYYLNRARNTNDLHGLGALLMMCWQVEFSSELPVTNRAPFISISNPQDSSYFWPGTDINITADGRDIDGQIVQVEFYEGENLLFTDGQSPWQYTWEAVAQDEYDLTVVAMDDNGATTISEPVRLFVTDEFIIIEAETGYISNGSVDSDHPGFTGSGFVNLVNQVGTYLELTFTVPKAGLWGLSFRYGNGSAANRTCEIRLDGEVEIPVYDFPSTGDWPNWTYSLETALDLSEGSHTLRITGITSESAPNIDHLRLLYQGPGTGVTSNSLTINHYVLYQNYPNPFNPETQIVFALKQTSHVKLDIYNALGQIVATPINEQMESGLHRINFDASGLTSGLYFYRVYLRDFVATRKMWLLK